MPLWQVTRFCCLSGMCFDCRAIVTGGSRKRMVVAENLTEEAAVRLEAENEVRTIPRKSPRNGGQSPTATGSEREELLRICRKVVGATGFEPAASRSRTERSTRLSHAPTESLV